MARCAEPYGPSTSVPGNIVCRPFSKRSEDCLYLNIYAPLDTKKKSKKRVLVFIPGGRYETGTGAAPLYNAEEFARKGDIIVVTFNYRLGAFGFLATGSSHNDITGNYGLLDQTLAMQWVKRNIKKFGGNQKKITIAGQGAGAYSVAIHLTSGRADKLFTQAIIQSSPYTIPLKTMDVARGQAERFAAKAGCLEDLSNINITCLHTLSPEQIISIQVQAFSHPDNLLRAFMPWLPHIDGKEVRTGLIEALKDTSFKPKPLMLGAVKDEGQLFIKQYFRSVSVAQAQIIIEVLVKNAPAGIMDLYPFTNTIDYSDELAEITTDYVFTCPNRLVARAQSDRMSVYTYDFQQPLNFSEAYPKPPYCVGRVCHGVEVPFVFQSARKEPFLFNPDEFALSDELITYWSSFVKYGNPNQDVVNGTMWVRFSDTEESTILMEAGDDGIRNVRGFKNALCDVWDTSGYQ